MSVLVRDKLEVDVHIGGALLSVRNKEEKKKVVKKTKVKDPNDLGPCKDIEDLVNTKEIVKKYQKMIYEEPPQSSSSEEDHFGFDLTNEKQIIYEAMMKLKREKKAEAKERAEYMRKYGGLEGWYKLRPKVEARYNTKEEEDNDEEVKE